MKLVNYVDYSKVRVVNGKDYPTSYFMLEFGDNDNVIKVLITPVNKNDYAILRKSAKLVVKGKLEYQDTNRR